MEITMRMEPNDLTYLKESFNKNLENLLFRYQLIRGHNPNQIDFNNMQERINALNLETNIQTITNIISDLIDMRYNIELLIDSPLISNYELSLFNFFIETLQYDETYNGIIVIKDMLKKLIDILNSDLRLINLHQIDEIDVDSLIAIVQPGNDETIQEGFYDLLQQSMYQFKYALDNYNEPEPDETYEPEHVEPDETVEPDQEGGSRRQRKNRHKSKRKSIKRKIIKKRKYSKKSKKHRKKL